MNAATGQRSVAAPAPCLRLQVGHAITDIAVRLLQGADPARNALTQ